MWAHVFKVFEVWLFETSFSRDRIRAHTQFLLILASAPVPRRLLDGTCGDKRATLCTGETLQLVYVGSSSAHTYGKLNIHSQRVIPYCSERDNNAHCVTTATAAPPLTSTTRLVQAPNTTVWGGKWDLGRGKERRDFRLSLSRATKEALSVGTTTLYFSYSPASVGG